MRIICQIWHAILHVEFRLHGNHSNQNYIRWARKSTKSIQLENSLKGQNTKIRAISVAAIIDEIRPRSSWECGASRLLIPEWQRWPIVTSSASEMKNILNREVHVVSEIVTRGSVYFVWKRRDFNREKFREFRCPPKAKLVWVMVTVQSTGSTSRSADDLCEYWPLHARFVNEIVFKNGNT